MRERGAATGMLSYHDEPNTSGTRPCKPKVDHETKQLDRSQVDSIARKSPMPLRGRVGPYDLRFEIAKGGMASVCLAVNAKQGGFQRIVAIKRIRDNHSDNPSFASMFIDEATIASRISHANVCQVFDFGSDAGEYFIAMEYLVGESLASVAKALRSKPELREDHQHERKMARVVADLAEGLHAAHSLRDDAGRPLDVVHRDATPDNLFVLYEGRSKVTDFGIARARNKMHKTQTSAIKGKLSYLAPEQITGEAVDRRVDVWSLGVVLWELLSGQSLFWCPTQGETLYAVCGRPIVPPSTMNPFVSPRMDAIVLKALERNPAQRYGSGRALSRELENFLAEGAPVSALDVHEWMLDLFPAGPDYHGQLMRAARQCVLDGLEPQLPSGVRPGPGVAETSVGEADTEFTPQKGGGKASATTHELPRSRPLEPLMSSEIESDRSVRETPLSSVSTPAPARLVERGSPRPSRAPRSPALMLGVIALFGLSLGTALVLAYDSMTAAARTRVVLAAPRLAADLTRFAPDLAIEGSVGPGELQLGGIEIPAASAATSPTRAATRPTAPRATTPAPAKHSEPEPERAEAEARVRAGRVQISAAGGRSEVLLGTSVLGRTPLGVTLPAGTHQLTFRPLDGGPVRRVRVEVQPERVTFLAMPK